jgi:lipopolysaccharide transport system permease protein
MMNAEHEIIITPPSKIPSIGWKELWRYKELFIALTWRDIAVRYKQAVLGLIWVIIQPLIAMVVFTFLFNRLGGIKSGDGTPYPIFLYVGLLIWQYFSTTLINAANSMTSNAGLIQKVYFPRLVIPATAAASALVDLVIASLILAMMMIYYKLPPKPLSIVLLPVLILTTILVSLGFGLLAAAVNVKYRDIKHALPFAVQIMMFITPVMYPINMLDSHPTTKAVMLWLNPISGVISNARAVVLGKSPVCWDVLVISLLMSISLFLLGLLYFRKAEHYFADLV